MDDRDTKHQTENQRRREPGDERPNRPQEKDIMGETDNGDEFDDIDDAEDFGEDDQDDSDQEPEER